MDETTRASLLGGGCPRNVSCHPEEDIDEENNESDDLEVAAAHKRVYDLLKFMVGTDLKPEEHKPSLLVSV